jgi:predicted nucleic acid-binding protein
MVHLDTNLLVALIRIDDSHHRTALRVVTGVGPFATSAVAWTEFRSKPDEPTDVAAAKGILSGGIIPFDEAAASLAGKLFHLTGSKRRTRLDTMIAATAILSGAELATTNPADFEPFVPHGLNLHSF